MELFSEVWRGERGGRGTLVAMRCERCGIDYLPHVDRCPECLEADLVPRELSDGVLYSYSILHITPPGFPAVVSMGYVDFPGGARVFGHIAQTDPADLRPGMPVDVEIAELFRSPDDEPVLCFRFTVDGRPEALEGGARA